MITLYLLVAIIGGVVGAAEIMNTHRSDPFAAIQNRFSGFYIVINAAASIITLYLIDNTTIVKLPSFSPASQSAIEVIAAGCGAMVILRVGISVQTSGNSLIISLGALLQPLLRAADGEVDRERAYKNSIIVKEVMHGLPLQLALQSLPSMCISSLRKAPEQEVRDLGVLVGSLEKQDGPDEIKLLSLGNALIHIAGERFFRLQIDTFREIVGIRNSAQATKTP